MQSSYSLRTQLAQQIYRLLVRVWTGIRDISGNALSASPAAGGLERCLPELVFHR